MRIVAGLLTHSFRIYLPTYKCSDIEEFEIVYQTNGKLEFTATGIVQDLHLIPF
jgi:hypothetical protein